MDTDTIEQGGAVVQLIAAILLVIGTVTVIDTSQSFLLALRVLAAFTGIDAVRRLRA